MLQAASNYLATSGSKQLSEGLPREAYHTGRQSLVIYHAHLSHLYRSRKCHTEAQRKTKKGTRRQHPAKAAINFSFGEEMQIVSSIQRLSVGLTPLT